MQHKRKSRKTEPVLKPNQERTRAGYRSAGWGLIVLVVLVLSLAVFLIYRSTRHPGPVALSGGAAHDETNAGYIDPKTCAACHSDIANSFHRTGMGRSLYRPSISNRIENYSSKDTIYNRRSDTYYVMEERGGVYYQQRYQLGPDGHRINVAEERVDYIVGSGDQARSYLHRDSENRLIELPVTWYSEDHGHWAMTPGYDQPRQSDFHGPISQGCFFCHDAYPRASAGEHASESGEPVFPDPIPEGVDCQRCHGPGEAHVRAAGNANSSESQIRNAIVNPARLSRDRQLEVCMECHLSTSGSQDENVSRRFDRGVYSYRPGQPLADYKLYFDRADAEQQKDKFDIVDAAYRLSFSTCFRKSGMTCLTCHDPHVEEHGQQAEARYVKVCESCHQSVRHTSALPAGADCISCHMPKRRSQYAVNIVLTDHYIQRNKPPGNLTQPMEEPENMPQSSGSLVLFYPKQLPDNAESKLYLLGAELRDGSASKDQIEEFEKLIEAAKPAAAEFYAILGEAYAHSGDHQNAERWLKEAYSRAPQYRPALEQLVQVLFAEAKYQEAADLLKQSVDTPPLDSALFADLGNAYARMGNLDAADAMLRKSIEVNPETAQAYDLLGLVAVQRGNEGDAKKDFEEALRLQPDLAEADDNLGKLLIGDQDLKEAEYYLKRAVTVDPKDADSHHTYGLLLMLDKKFAASAQELRQAASLDSANALVFSDLGDDLSQQGDGVGAAQAYEEALRLEPTLPQANLGLGTLDRQRGQIEESRKLCQLASQSADESIREAALLCLR